MGLKQNLGDLLRIGEIKDSVMEIIEAKIQLKKIELQEKAEEGVSGLIYGILLAAAAFLCLIFVLVLLAYFINQWLGEPWGYVIDLGIAILALVVLKTQKVTIKAKIQEEIMKEMDAMN
jgi:uncharacterized membrane protein YqjE